MADAPNRQARVLVVDDSPTIRRVVAQVLRHAGYDVGTAEDGDTGLVEAKAMNPDLILLDFVMPNMNGFQFIKHLDAEDDGRAPVVIMSTRADAVPVEALRTLGVVDSITKPFTPEAILAMVSGCLAKYGVHRRDETTRVTLEPPIDDAVALATLPPDLAAEPARNDRGRVDHALRELTRLLTNALASRTIGNAHAVATQVCEELRGALSAQLLRELEPVPVASLSGDLTGVPLPEVLQLLKFQSQTGVLEVNLEHRGGASRARFDIAVKKGVVVSLRAQDPRADLLLGNYFVGAGAVSRPQLDSLLRTPSTTSIGKRLVHAGLVTTEQLRRCVGAQAQDLMVELLRARRGTFALRRGDEALPTTHVSPGFSIDMLLFEGMRRIDEWGVIERHVPTFDATFTLRSNDIDDLAPDDIEVLSLFRDGQSLTVRDVLRISALRAFDACKVLYRLISLKKLARIDDGGASSLLDDDDGPMLGAR